MKTSLINSKGNWLLSLLFILTTSAIAETKYVARVVSTRGNAFIFSPSGFTKQIIMGDHIEKGTQIMVEEGGQVDVVSYFEAYYKIGSGAHVSVNKDSIDLKSGRLYVSATQKNKVLSVKTANATAFHMDSKLIMSYDIEKGKAQVLSLNGTVDFVNNLDRNSKEVIPAGSFSVVDPKHFDGRPRPSTVVGYESYKKSILAFHGTKVDTPSQAVPNFPTDSYQVSRSIASVEEDDIIDQAVKSKKGYSKIRFIQLPWSISERVQKQKSGTYREPSSVGKVSAHDYLKARKPSGHPKTSYKPKTVKFRVHGSAKTKSAPRRQINSVESVKYKEVEPINSFQKSVALPTPKVERVPASVNPIMNESQAVNDFEKSLEREMSNQPKNSNDLNSLIQELKTFDKDYSSSY